MDTVETDPSRAEFYSLTENGKEVWDNVRDMEVSEITSRYGYESSEA